MRALVQRVSRARVSSGGAVTGEIGTGLLVLLGIRESDTARQAESLARKIVSLRIFEDDDGKMNRPVLDVGGAVLCVSQFTLYGDTRKGNRPSFVEAAASDQALPLYEHFCGEVERLGCRCERGAFGEHMDVELVNDGPVTIWIDTEDLQRPRRA